MDGVLQPGDYVGFTFFIGNMALLAATAFFLLERSHMKPKWRLSMTVSALICGIAAAHYYYMKGVWAGGGGSPTEFRYIDWTLTVPLMCVEFYLILAAVGSASKGILFRLLGASFAMLVLGFLGESNYAATQGTGNYVIMFVLSMAAWGIVLYEVYYGEASKMNEAVDNVYVKQAFGLLRRFALYGWAVYPVGYLAAMIQGADGALDVIYNLADMINKIGFGLVIYFLAKQDTEADQGVDQKAAATAN